MDFHVLLNLISQSSFYFFWICTLLPTEHFKYLTVASPQAEDRSEFMQNIQI